VPLASAKAFDFATENGVCQDILGPWAGRILALLSQSALGDVFKLSVSGLGEVVVHWDAGREGRA
jgi:hypothetical protein